MKVKNFYDCFIYIQERYYKTELKGIKYYKCRLGYDDYSFNKEEIEPFYYVRKKDIDIRLKKGMFYFYYKSRHYILLCDDRTDFENQILNTITKYETINEFVKEFELNIEKLLAIPKSRLFYIYMLAINSSLMRNFKYLQNKIGVGYLDEINREEKLDYKKENESENRSYNVYQVEDDSRILLLTDVEVDFLNTIIIDVLNEIIKKKPVYMIDLIYNFEDLYNSKVLRTRRKFNKYISVKYLNNIKSKNISYKKRKFRTVEKEIKTLYSQVEILYSDTTRKYSKYSAERANFEEIFNFSKNDILEMLKILPFLFYRNISPHEEISLRKDVFILPINVEKYIKLIRKNISDTTRNLMTGIDLKIDIIKGDLMKISKNLNELINELEKYGLIELYVDSFRRLIDVIKSQVEINFTFNYTDISGFLTVLNNLLNKINTNQLALILEYKRHENNTKLDPLIKYLKEVHKDLLVDNKILGTKKYEKFNKIKQYLSHELIFTYDDKLIENIENILNSIGCNEALENIKEKIVYININDD